jgi:hypothetical protein
LMPEAASRNTSPVFKGSPPERKREGETDLETAVMCIHDVLDVIRVWFRLSRAARSLVLSPFAFAHIHQCVSYLACSTFVSNIGMAGYEIGRALTPIAGDPSEYGTLNAVGQVG